MEGSEVDEGYAARVEQREAMRANHLHELAGVRELLAEKEREVAALKVQLSRPVPGVPVLASIAYQHYHQGAPSKTFSRLAPAARGRWEAAIEAVLRGVGLSEGCPGFDLDAELVAEGAYNRLRAEAAADLVEWDECSASANLNRVVFAEAVIDEIGLPRLASIRKASDL